MRKVLIKVGRYIWEFNARATLSMRVVALLPTGTTTTTGRRRRTFTRRAAAKEETTDTHEGRRRRRRRRTKKSSGGDGATALKNGSATAPVGRTKGSAATKKTRKEDDDGKRTQKKHRTSSAFVERLKPPLTLTTRQNDGRLSSSCVSVHHEKARAAFEKAKTLARQNEHVTAGIVCIQAIYVIVKTMKRTKKAIQFMSEQILKVKQMYRYAKENVFDKPKITRSATNDPRFRSLLKDYAKLIHDLYDVPIVPEFVETKVYAQVLEQGLEGAFETLDDIVLSGNARVLGHPLVVQRRFVGEDSERLKKYGALEVSKEDELNKFVTDVVENSSNNGGDVVATENNKTSKMLQKMEKKMSKKILSIAARTGTLFLESGVQSFSARIFDAEFYFDVREYTTEERKDTAFHERIKKLPRSRAIHIAKTASDDRLRKVIEELQIPPIGILFPELERDIGRLVIAMACEAIDFEVSLPNVDYAVKFDLRVKDQKEYDEDERKMSEQKMSLDSNLRSEDGDELAQALADDFMARRKAVAPMFITPEVERKTYVDIIKGILGEIGLNAPSVIAEVLGMDVTIQVIRKKNDDKKIRTEEKDEKDNAVEMSPMTSMGNSAAYAFLRERFKKNMTKTRDEQIAETLITSSSSSSSSSAINSDAISRGSVEAFIDWLLADAAYNIRAIPDDVERALYANCFELFLDGFLETTQKVEFSILGRTVKIRTRVAKDAPRDYTKLRRFRPDWQALDAITEEIKIEPEALKRITSNVHAFVLAFLSQILEDASTVICGHEIRLALTTPTVLRKSYDFDDANLSFDGTAQMRVDSESKTGDTLSFASSKALQQPPSRKRAQNAFSAMDALNALATELATEAASASFSESNKGEANDDQSKGGDFSIDSIFVDLQRDLQKQIAQFGFKNSFTNTSLLESDAISHDAVAFSVFKKYCSPPDETFPFPYLTKVQFEVASLEVIKMAGFRYVSESITQKMEALAKAADEDKNGVIQWGEWYCVSDAIISAVKMAKAQNSK